MRTFKSSVAFVLLALVALAPLPGCSSMGATNTTNTNVAVTSFEGVGTTLKALHDTEASMVKSGTITAAQDAQFQILYADAYAGYKALGAAMSTALTATGASQQSAQATVVQLTGKLPGLISAVSNFLVTLGVKI